MSINNKIKISVIMPIYKVNVTHLINSVNSIVNQTVKEFELLIILDNPNLTLPNHPIFSDSRIKIIRNEFNCGLSYSLNLGIKSARGKYIFRQDADDISNLTRFKKQLDLLESGHRLLSTRAVLIDQDGNFIGKSRNLGIFHNFIRQLQLYCFALNPVIHSSIAGFKDDFLKFPYDETLKYAQDLDLWIRLKNLTKIYFMRDELVCYRVSNDAVKIKSQNKIASSLRFVPIINFIDNLKYSLIMRFSFYYFIRLKNYGFSSKKRIYNNLNIRLPDSIPPGEVFKRVTFDLTANSSVYGIMFSLKSYSNFHKVILNTVCQHGVYLSGIEDSFRKKYCKKIIVMGPSMADEVKMLNIKKPILMVGPYIRYASDLISGSELVNYKKRYGKTLLVFLPHGFKYKDNSFQLMDLIYSPENIVSKIETYKDHYESIFVLGWSRTSNEDIRDYYQKHGFVYMQSGDPNDPWFLSRQKLIISMAEHTISFHVSTHIGYCIALGKSHEIINLSESVNHDLSNKNFFLTYRVKEGDKGRFAELLSKIEDNNYNSILELTQNSLRNIDCRYEINESELLEAFYNSGKRISERQMEICNRYWGLNIKLDEKTIKEFLK